ncbi:uncharacterized protein CBL_20770 [Carabus blaptoides fortunei]
MGLVRLQMDGGTFIQDLMPFIMSQFYPKLYTMIPAGLSVGFGGGPLWCAVAAEAYSQITWIKSNNVEDICGANICPNITIAENPNLEPPVKEKIQLISGIYLGCMVAA